MFVQTWKKYLPVIVFLMKRSTKGEQTLDMNLTDFERATGGRKVKLNFSRITINNGRTDYDAKLPVLVTDLIMVLQENKPAPEQLAYMTAKIPMGRLGTVEEVAALSCWIVSKEASFNTGFIFDISGGRATY